MTPATTANGHYDYDSQVLHFAGQEWVRVRRLDAPFGLPEKALRKIFEREEAAFTPADTRLVELPTEGGKQTVRVFSRSGVRLLAMLAHTPEAKRLRVAFATGRDSIFDPKQIGSAQLALPGTYRLPSNTVRVLDDVSAIIEPDHPAQEIIQGYRDGSRPLPADPTVDRLVSSYEVGQRLMGKATLIFAEVRREAERVGYSQEFIKGEARRRRRAA